MKNLKTHIQVDHILRVKNFPKSLDLYMVIHGTCTILHVLSSPSLLAWYSPHQIHRLFQVVQAISMDPIALTIQRDVMSFLTDIYIHIVSMAIGGCILKQIMIHVLTSCCILNGAKLWLLIRQNHCTSHILPNFSLIFPSSPTFT